MATKTKPAKKAPKKAGKLQLKNLKPKKSGKMKSALGGVKGAPQSVACAS
ncbi:MAG: hypothetical protein ABSH48_25965 [Verrucomicrobiota bacterium]|jgi:hypothetical protein